MTERLPLVSFAQAEGGPPPVIRILQRLRAVAPEDQVLVLTAGLDETAERLARTMGAVDSLEADGSISSVDEGLDALAGGGRDQS